MSTPCWLKRKKKLEKKSWRVQHNGKTTHGPAPRCRPPPRGSRQRASLSGSGWGVRGVSARWLRASSDIRFRSKSAEPRSNKCSNARTHCLLRKRMRTQLLGRVRLPPSTVFPRTMANVLLFHVCAVLMFSGVDSCLIPSSVYVIVPNELQPGSLISTVQVSHCDTESTRLTSSDPSFTVTSGGVIETSESVSVSAAGRTFSVRARDGSGPESEMVVHLVHRATPKKQAPARFLKRFKRRWSPPPFNILENKPETKRLIERVVSDSEAKYVVYYTISGPGVNERPVGVFSLDREGNLFVHKEVDREEFPQFKLTVRVFDTKTNVEKDDPLDITIDVDDVNDNAPTFTGQLKYTVLEQCAVGTVVGTMKAEDRDQAGTLHTKIRYSLKSGLDLFAIHPGTGVITTKTNTLDREVKDQHLVTVEIRDMDGAVTGLFNTGTATITVGDINDNPPTFNKTSYAASITENEVDQLILRIPVGDKDLEPDNWISQFVITKGNENGNFRIDNDPKTNDGLLYVSKPLDFEQTPNVKLEIMARNKADLVGTQAQWLSVPVNVDVINVDEGPQFSAPTIRLNVKENTANGSLIGTYTALDPETKSSAGIMYFKTTDPASWINVDRNNGELRVANTIDRESDFVQDGIYNITMRAVDASGKTGTGTVIIVVEDVNDNFPTLPSRELVMCEKKGELASMLITAEDKDKPPFSSPFRFSLPSDQDDKWSLTKFNDTSATLKQTKELPTGIYSLPVDIKDLQGFGKMQTATVRICSCRNNACIVNPHSVSLGPMGILALLLPLFLLLLLGLLLGILCATKAEQKPLDIGDSGGILLKSNTEAPGEEGAPYTVTDSIVKGSVKGAVLNSGWLDNTGTLGTITRNTNGMHDFEHVTSDLGRFNSGQYNQFNYAVNSEGFDNRYLTQDSTLLRNWQTNGLLLDKRVAFFRNEADGRYAEDVIHRYGYEGAGSAAGSVGCCSDIGDDNNLDFLNGLGPKFKTLGEVSRKK